MGSIPPELSLDVRPTHVPKTIREFLEELDGIGSVSGRLLRLDEFVKRLEEEMRKIDAFKRELPLCMLLLNDAILALNEESEQCRAKNVQPVLEEFMPLNKNCDEEGNSETERENDSRDKMNWMSSVQLWNAGDCKNIDSKYDQKQNLASHEKVAEEECRVDDPFQSQTNRTSSRAFMPFKSCSVFPIPVTRKEEQVDVPVARLSLLTPGIKNPREENSCNGFSKATSNQAASSSIISGRGGPQAPAQQQTARKQRRCWSSELHRRFVNALQQLGGSQVATPKQIRDLMQVDGLTNDEVKSHLQKYRLHSRRVPAATSTASNQSMVTLWNFWMQQDHYGESLKQTSSQSGSPQGPLQLAGTGGGTSTTGEDSIEEEEQEEEKKSESYSWKSHIHVSGKDDV